MTEEGDVVEDNITLSERQDDDGDDGFIETYKLEPTSNKLQYAKIKQSPLKKQAKLKSCVRRKSLVYDRNFDVTLSYLRKVNRFFHLKEPWYYGSSHSRWRISRCLY